MTQQTDLHSDQRRPGRRSDDGFTVVELLVASALTSILLISVLGLVALHAALARSQPERLDVQQRARAASETLHRDLLRAGAGIDVGPRGGPLVHYLPPIVPRRMGLQVPDGPAVARADTLTVTYVAGSMSQTTTAAPLDMAAPLLQVTPYATCPPPVSLCGLAPGATVLILSRSGGSDWFRLTTVSSAGAVLQSLQIGAASHGIGDLVAEAERYTYYFDAAARQLRRYNGFQTDVPVVDDVVGVAFEYFGDPDPPTRPKPPPGEANCLYAASGQLLSGMPTLSGAGASLASLPLSMFVDGPWCGNGPNQFDADLLRIRTVRVTLRVQASPDWARASGPSYGVAGTSRSALTSVPDLHVTFDVSPRNMAVVREIPA
jgi:hypothetical protein